MNEIERQLGAAAADPQHLAGPIPGPGSDAPLLDRRIENGLHAMHAELDAPSEPRLARLLRRIGVPDLVIPLVTATPGLRRSWFAAVTIAVLFALSAASNNQAVGVDRIGVFLTLAPLVPLLGVALAFGKGVDPTHDLVVAAPRDTFAVFLIRATTVLIASSILLLLCAVVLPAGGAYRLAWLLPSLAITATTMWLSATWPAQRVAAVIASGWVLGVLVASGAASTAATFGPVMQGLSGALAVVASWALFRHRQHFNGAGGR